MLKPDEKEAKTLQDFCKCFNLTQVIDMPTRITQFSKSLIDVIITDNTHLIRETQIIPHSISDHDLIIATLQLKKPRPKPFYITTRSFKHYNKVAFLEDISNAPWSVIDAFDNVEDKLYTFNSLFTKILDQHAPLKTVKLRTRPTPFIDDNIRALMKTRNYRQKLARQTNDPAAWSGYKNFKREVKRELRIAQRNFVEDSISQNANDPNAMWKTIRSCIPKKSASTRVADRFNQFLTSVGETKNEKINLLANECGYVPTQLTYSPEFPIAEQFTFTQVHYPDIERIVSSLATNKAPRIDKLPARVIKDSAPIIIPSITSIINTSLTTSTYPGDWKIAEVSPILKEGDFEEAGNNRPISLLPIVSKVCEKAALNQVAPYVTANKRSAMNQTAETKKGTPLKLLLLPPRTLYLRRSTKES